MSDVAGLVMNSVSFIDTLGNIFKSFQSIHLDAKQFGIDYETCRIRMDAACFLLLRWGEAWDLPLHDESLNHQVVTPLETSPSLCQHHSPALAQALVDRILADLQEAKRMSEIYNTGSGDTSQAHRPYDGDDIEALSDATENLHTRFTTRFQAIRWLRGPSIVAKWTLLGKRQFENLISRLMLSVDELYKAFPLNQAKENQICQNFIGDIEDSAQLDRLEEACKGVDTTLGEYAHAARRSRQGKHHRTGP